MVLCSISRAPHLTLWTAALNLLQGPQSKLQGCEQNEWLLSFSTILFWGSQGLGGQSEVGSGLGYS